MNTFQSYNYINNEISGMHLSINLCLNSYISFLIKKLILGSFCVSRYKLVTSLRNLLKRHINMFSMSTWHDGGMRSLEYAEIHFPMVLYFQLLILLRTTLYNLKMRSKFSIITLSRFPWWCISHIGMDQIVRSIASNIFQYFNL